ncbi:MAG: sigma 54-dependent Fis family transcriptional regulator [Deltaproteobacteria bacterium]|nr:sigma 54-dependent Fis family transcriptional regulator [Deltaproteobacteria bacterium]
MVAPFVTRPTGPTGGRTIRTFRVAVVGGPAAGAAWNGQAERCALGSHPSNDLVIEDPTVSRFHCEITMPKAGDRVAVRDLGSRNGILVGDVAIAQGAVPDGAVLALGHTRVTIAIDAGATAEIPASDRTSFGSLVGAGEAMRELFGQLEKVAASDATVLVEGETGTGKEGIAEALHDAGARTAGPFVVIDCGAIPANLLESELFGHEAGAFTGATERRIGAFEQAHGGTVFLDEVGELPPELQPKLLRALEAREIRRVGGRAAIRCDVRIIAATNRDLRAEVNRGAFRADLYYRLAVVKLEVPPLRERPGDLPLLVDALLHRIGAPTPLHADLTDPTFVAALAASPWPGNVRELRNHLEQCVVFAERRLPSAPSTPHPQGATIDPSLPYEVARKQAIDAFERDYVTALVARADGNVARAARDAGVNRAYLHRLLRRHGLR